LVLRVPVVVGTIAGALLGLGTLDNHNGWGFVAFFVLWQGAYEASLAPLLRDRARTRPLAHRFLKAGGRFSPKALMPSF
jgi:hypothetical protein